MSDDEVRIGSFKMTYWDIGFETALGAVAAPQQIPMQMSVEVPAGAVDIFSPLRTLQEVDVFFDAGTRRGNPGPSGIAVYAAIDLPEDKHFIYKLRVTEFVGQRTNNEAEWLALIKALEIFEGHAPVLRRLAIHSDSKLVVHQARGEWKTRGNLRSLNARATKLARKLVDRGCLVSIVHVPREQNAEADAMVTALLDHHTGRQRGY